jgi:hypothetical protein
LIGSLTLPQVAATLAAALVGFQTVNAAGYQLIDQAMLNTMLVLVVATSLLGPIMTQRFLRRYPGYNSLVPKSAGSVGAVLKGNGYNTSWFGKMHNVPD